MTRHLVAEGVADPARVVAIGRSAGGMLMGAIANLRPDLYAVVIASAPFVDVVTGMMDPTARDASTSLRLNSSSEEESSSFPAPDCLDREGGGGGGSADWRFHRCGRRSSALD